MTVLEWGAIGELIGGIAIIVSLIYVGIQVSDSAGAVRSASANDANSALQNWYMQIGSDQQTSELFYEALMSEQALSNQKEFQFMIRLKIPAGRLTADQYLAIDELAGRYANGSLRITTRQDFQLHGVIKKNLKATIAEINATLLTTLGACGDVVRNITTSPAPIRDAVHQQLERDAKLLTEKLLPRTHAYHEIWLDGERLDTGEEEVEPLYGATYLPRKFKIGLATPDDNSIDVLTHDIGIIALFDGERLTGYNLALGGGMGMTHNKPKTYPRLATPLVFVEPDGLVPAVEAVIKLQRDYGGRSDRKHARLKYLVDDMGVEWIKAKLEEYFGAPLSGPRPMPEFKVVDHLGWHPQGDGRWYLGIPVSSGRIVDRDGQPLRTALREVIAEYRLDPILTPAQDIILSGADAARSWRALSDAAEPDLSRRDRPQAGQLSRPARVDHRRNTLEHRS